MPSPFDALAPYRPAQPEQEEPDLFAALEPYATHPRSALVAKFAEEGLSAPRPEPRPTGGDVAASFGNVLVKSGKELAAGMTAGLGSLLTKIPNPSDVVPTLRAQRKETSDKLGAIYRATYEDLTDAQGEFINDFTRMFSGKAGLPGGHAEAVAGIVSTTAFSAVNAINPVRLAKVAGAALGLLPKAAVLAYGAAKGVAGLRKMVMGAKAAGKIPDAALDSERAIATVGRAAREFKPALNLVGKRSVVVEDVAKIRAEKVAMLTEEVHKLQGKELNLVGKAVYDIDGRRLGRVLSQDNVMAQVHVGTKTSKSAAPGVKVTDKALLTKEQFLEQHPLPVRLGGLEQRKLSGLERQAMADNLAGEVPSSTVRVVEEAPKVTTSRARDVREIPLEALYDRRGIPHGLKMAHTRPARSVDASDEVWSAIGQETQQARKEVAMRARDARARGLENPHSPMMFERPQLVPTNLREFGQNLARTYVADRDAMILQAEMREGALKDALGGRYFNRLSADAKAAQQFREDLTAVVQKRGNPNVSHGDTYERALGRVTAHKDGRKALDLVPKIRAYLDSLRDEMNDLGARLGDDVIPYKNNWLHQQWVDLKSLQQRGQVARRPTKGSFEQASTFATYFDGVVNGGLTPRTLDIAEILHLGERQYAEIFSIKKVLKELGEVGVMDDGLEAIRVLPGIKPPPGYVAVEMPFLRRMLGEDGNIYLHKEIWKPLKNILLRRPGQGRAEDIIDNIAAVAKRANFSFTLFHAGTLGESAINAMGPVGGVRLAANLLARGGAIPFVGDAVQAAGGAKNLDRLTRAGAFAEAEARSLFYGVTKGAPKTDLMVTRWETLVDTASRKLGKAAAPLQGYKWLQKNIDTALWERWHHPMKVIAFETIYDGMLRTKRGQYAASGLRPIKGLHAKALRKLSDDEIGYRVASYVNDEFGGQNWEVLQDRLGRFLADPRVMKWLRRLWLSPDWNVSSVRAGLAFAQMMPGTPFYDPVRGMLGLKHWRNAFFGTWVYGNVANYVMSGRFIWENEPGKDRLHVDTGFTSKDINGRQRKIFWHFGKQYREAMELTASDHLMLHTAPDVIAGKKPPSSLATEAVRVPQKIPGAVSRFLVRKLAPVWTNLSPSSPGDYPSLVDQAIEQAEREGRELDGAEFSKVYMMQIATGFRPFSAQQARFGAASALAPFPPSMGMSLYRAEKILVDAAARGDDAELRQQVAEALRANDYSEKEIREVLRRSRTKGRKLESE